MRPSFFVFASLVVGACSSTHGLDDAATPHVEDAQLVVIDAFAAPDASTERDAGCVMPIGPTGLIPRETAACLGLAEAACAGCHVRGDVWSLRPMGAPPPAGITPAPPGACGLCMP